MEGGMSTLVATTVAEGIATLRLDRAEKRNALSGELMSAIAAALDKLRDDPAVRVVVIAGNGPVFSSGIDHQLLLEIMAKARTAPFAHVHHDIQEVFHRIERLHKPVVAALHGVCVGMAFELALACDFRLATTSCLVGLPEIAFGIVPDVGGTTRLVRACGPVRARELIMTGRILKAEDAFPMGLVTELCADEAALVERTTAFARQLASLPPVAVGHAKQLVQQSAELDRRASFQLEGTVQDVLMRQPDLADHFPKALAFIKDEMRRAMS
jgi:enoyl-CoA hydratase/carnithine racemase